MKSNCLIEAVRYKILLGGHIKKNDHFHFYLQLPDKIIQFKSLDKNLPWYSKLWFEGYIDVTL